MNRPRIGRLQRSLFLTIGLILTMVAPVASLRLSVTGTTALAAGRGSC